MKPTPRSLLLIMLSILIGLVLGSEAQGCSCIEQNTPVCAAYSRADAVFVGYVKEIQPVTQRPGEAPHALLHLVVEQSFKGVSGSEVDVATDWGTSCDIGFKMGERWLIYANNDQSNSGLYAGACARTTGLEHATEDLNYIRGRNQKTQEQFILGRLLEDRYTPLPALKVTVQDGDLRMETSTDAEGAFAFSLPRSGNYVVRAYVSFAAVVMAYNNEVPVEVKSTDRQTSLEYTANISPGQCQYRELGVFRVDLHATAEIDGSVTDKNDHPLARGYVWLIESEDLRTRNHWRSQKIEATGVFKFEGVAPGRYFLAINPDDEAPGDDDAPYARTYYPGVPTFNEAIPISITEGAKLQNVDIKLGAPLKERVVTGKVVWADGKTAPTAYVSWYEGASERYVGMVKTDEKGNFSFKVFGDFRYEIQARNVVGKSAESEKIRIPATLKLKPLTLIISSK